MLQPNQIKSIVLYADDDPDDVELISAGFKPYGDFIEVKTFPNGAELLSYIRRLSPLDIQPCLVILDINMPLLNGLQTLKLIREQTGFESMPIVLFTTFVSAQDRLFIKRYNAEVLIKPIEELQFRGIIQQFVSHCTNDPQEDSLCK